MAHMGDVFEGKTLDAAVKRGLDTLGLSRAEVMITIVEEGSGGFLGLGARPYRVRVMRRPGGPPVVDQDRDERRRRGSGRDRRERDRGREGRPRDERRGEGRGEGRGDERRGEGRGDERRGEGRRRDERRGAPVAGGREGRPRDERRGEGRGDERRGEGRGDERRGEERPGERRDRDRGREPERERDRGREGRPREVREEPRREVREEPRREVREEAAAAMPPRREPVGDVPSAGEEGGEGRRRRRRGRRGGRRRHGEPSENGTPVAGAPAVMAVEPENLAPAGEPAEVAAMPAAPAPAAPAPAAPAPAAPAPAAVTTEAPRRESAEAGGPGLSGEELAAESVRMTRELLAAMGFEAKVGATVDGDHVDVTAEVAQDEELLTGRKGEVRQALQHILNRRLNRGETSRYHLQLEINDFWRRREEELRDMARTLAEEALSSGGEAVTEYLNAQERRIVHVTLRDDTRVKTYALGTGMIKRVAIAPADFAGGPRDEEG